ncbi:HisS family protein [Actinotalea sp. Marseille-Q4924]|uniref:histidine--tRNA ligase n=1 Tax=Actinotalea sp. Marseille-Q4924 TaxID=2866571 RepID=UPI001CE4A68F|nr:ATP phosphoribosyltransferase regulatory subunit [Actinotalea sp. Marseille-Q4924]
MAKAVVPARGMRDILPKDKAKRDAVLDTIRATYRRNGFAEIETPAIEPLSRLRSNQGGENESMLYEILRRGLDPEQALLPADATDLALRYDLTVPLTRFYASHAAELPTVFRALQIGSVWRAERPQKGRYRQFTQCDIDIIGEPGILAEVDLIVSTMAAFDALGMGADVTLLVNDRRVLQDLLEAAGVAPAAVPDTLIALDKLDKVGREGVLAEIARKELAPDDVATLLLDTVEGLQRQGGPEDEPLRTGRVVVGGREVGLYDLPDIVRAVAAVLPGARVVLDATMVRGMGYYTGPIFEVRHAGSSGSVAGGGRYDGVVGKWLGRDVPACGFSIGFERIIDLLPDPMVDGRRIALLHGPQDPAELLGLRADLQADGAAVTLVKPPRKVSGAFFDGLVGEGFTHVADARADDPRALRELSRS